MSERLGEILQARFGWPQACIDKAVRMQQEDTRSPRHRIGYYLRQTPSGANPDLAPDLSIALIYQQAKQPSFPNVRASLPFDRIEYQELGLLYRFERQDMGRKLQYYAWLIIGLVVYLVFPIQITTLPGGEFIRLYAGIGAALVLAGLVMGDYLLKSYALFLKRLFRISRSRAEIRAAAQRLGLATQTAMPFRGAELRDIPYNIVPERPDPEITGLRRSLPFFYVAWGALKLCALLSFLTFMTAGEFTFAGQELLRSSVLLTPIIVCWFHYMGRTCVRYHATLKEGKELSPNAIYPRATTETDFIPVGRFSRRWWLRMCSWLAFTGTCVAAIAVLARPTAAGMVFWPAWATVGAYAIGRVIYVLQKLSGLAVRTGMKIR